MGQVEQNRHFAEHRTGLGNAGNDGIALDDFEPSLDQDIKMSSPAASWTTSVPGDTFRL